MLAFERLLEPDCTESPECLCGKEMRVSRVDTLPGQTDTYIRVYQCPACEHEMRLTVWAAAPV